MQLTLLPVLLIKNIDDVKENLIKLAQQFDDESNV